MTLKIIDIKVDIKVDYRYKKVPNFKYLILQNEASGC